LRITWKDVFLPKIPLCFDDYFEFKITEKMSLTINLPTSVEQQFRKEATINGLSLDNYLLRLLQQASKISQKQLNSKQYLESELLKKINLDISEEEWTNYRHLVGLMRAEKLTPQAHETLIALGDKIEIANAQRVKYLFELAELRGISVEKLMENLKIEPIEI
jgi:hypothetical protein